MKLLHIFVLDPDGFPFGHYNHGPEFGHGAPGNNVGHGIQPPNRRHMFGPPSPNEFPHGFPHELHFGHGKFPLHNVPHNFINNNVVMHHKHIPAWHNWHTNGMQLVPGCHHFNGPFPGREGFNHINKQGGNRDYFGDFNGKPVTENVIEDKTTVKAKTVSTTQSMTTTTEITTLPPIDIRFGTR